MVFHGTRLVFHRAERRRREARHETYITPKLVTTRRSILGPPAEGRPGPSDDNNDAAMVMMLVIVKIMMLVSKNVMRRRGGKAPFMMTNQPGKHL